MDIFATHADITRDYRDYINSFIRIADERIRQSVYKELESGKLWPDPLIQFNPAFKKAGPIEQVADRLGLHHDLKRTFTGFHLYQHQVEAIDLGLHARDFVVTSGTGSGKSLTYIASILHHLFNTPAAQGIQAIIVYPMNALINSQKKALNDFATSYTARTGNVFPIRFDQYTGQEKQDQRDDIMATPPHILLTNYMMLELILTRLREQTVRRAIFDQLRFLVFDELHTYRGRQGADVALLIRRILSQCVQPVTCIGTSATMVSGGSLAEQKTRIAEVATRFFGKNIGAEQIVTETLERSISGGGLPSVEQLKQAVRSDVSETTDPDSLSNHPVLMWLEPTIALLEHDGDLVRQQPLQLVEIAQRLSDASSCSVEECTHHLRDLLHKLSLANAAATRAGRRDAVLLPFKLHQFFAQTGSVWATVSKPAERTIILDPNIREITENGIMKPLYPVVFSRTSGYEYICVRLQPDGVLVPREFRDIEGPDTDTPADTIEHDGYLLGVDLWSDEDCESMPEAWIRETRDGKFQPKTEKKARFPRSVWFTDTGQWSDKPKQGWQRGWFMSAPLLFDPSSGTDFAAQTREANKLTSLGMEGRSTSTTITCFSILDRLAQHDCDPEFQKLLSFTDNRQDAALQSGHFNDFIKVVQIRSAIQRAVKEAPDGMLTIHTIGNAIFDTLKLPFNEYAGCKTETPMHSVRALYEDTFRKFLTQRALYDLRRSWRIVLPNLEQCALLKIDYLHINELAAQSWDTIPEMQLLDENQRYDLLYGVLEAFRLGYALSSRNHLDEPALKENESAIRERLKAPWTLERDEKLMRPTSFCLGYSAQKKRPFVKLIGSRSLLGKFIIQYFRDHAATRLDQAAYKLFMERLLDQLENHLFLESRTLATGKSAPSRLFWLKVDCIVWKPGDGKTALSDRLKFRSYKGNVINPPNAFFQRLYQYDFGARKLLRGDEHTGQLNNEMRQQREQEFLEGRISALFCSPTMELGIDVKLLSIVHMRNVPPNPANYAQRAGRAGRNGQAALIFNFCSSHSPHDRHYFNQQRALVAGTVSPPRLDLCNEELLRCHLHAMVLAEVGLATLSDERASSLASLVDMTDEKTLDLQPEIVERLRLSASQTARIRTRFMAAIESFRPQLDHQAGHWFSETWVDLTLNSLANSLDRAMDRWRDLYRGARRLLAEASAQLSSGLLLPKSDEYRKAEREQRMANTQISQLRNDPRPGSGSNQLSEFYPYRYLASEAWLPGYNFTRLPLRVFVETQDGGGEYLSRPRSIALREYGPLNTIYHCGRKYQVNQLTSQTIDASLFSGAISRKAGYFLPADQKTLEICPFSHANLSEAGNRDPVNDLLEMGESRAIPKFRITCEEEERLARGYDLRTFFTVDEGHMNRIRKARLLSAGEPLLNIRYIPAARLRQISFGWRTQNRGEGFPIVTTTGIWKSSIPEPKPDATEPPQPMRLVKLTTSDSADALYIEPMKALGLDAYGVLTLQYALLRGISQVFQVEASEIGSESLGDAEAPNILLYEAAEGSLGVLSQFVGDPTVLRKTIDAAIAILRYDDASYTGPASYDDLLSYYNQRHHQKLDRFLIREALTRLQACQVELPGARTGEDYETQYKRLCDTLDPASSLERTFVDYLHDRSLRLPDAAQKCVPQLYCQPDFYYEPDAWVFIDGSPHDTARVRDRDTEVRQRMRSLGHDVLVYHYRDDMDQFIAARPDIFRKVRS